MPQLVGFKSPAQSFNAITIPPVSLLGHLRLVPSSLPFSDLKFLVASPLPAASVVCRKSLMNQNVWRPVYGAPLWAAGAGETAAGICSRDRDIFSGGKLVQGRTKGGIRVYKVLDVGYMMDWAHVPLLDQYLLREMVPVLVLATGLCTTLGMSLGALAGLIREVVVSGLPLRVAGAAAVLQMPYFAAVSLPMACLAASLFGLGRLQSDMECVALFAVGVPLWRLLLTPISICLVAAIMKLACHNCLVPYGSSQARKMVESALTTHMQGLRQTEDVTYQEYRTMEIEENGTRKSSSRNYGLQRIWYASKTKGNCLKGLLLLEVSPSGYAHRVVVADAGEWQTDESTWKFSNSTILDVSPKGNTRRFMQVEGLLVPSAPLSSGRGLWKRNLQELSRSDIKSEIKRLTKKLGVLSQKRQSREEVKNVVEAMGDQLIDASMINKLECFLCERNSGAFSCVVYGLIGAIATLAPGGRGSRSFSRATPFAWATVASLIYNTISATVVALGHAKAMSPWLSAWLPPLLACSALLAILLYSEHKQHLNLSM